MDLAVCELDEDLKLSLEGLLQLDPDSAMRNLLIAHQVQQTRFLRNLPNLADFIYSKN